MKPTVVRKPRRMTEKQCNKVIREYGFESRAEEILWRLEAMGIAWRLGEWWDRPDHLRVRRVPASVARPWVIATKAGFLGVSVHDDWIACVFDDDEAGARFVGASRPSGKWNHHAFATACHGHTNPADIVVRLDRTLDYFVHKIGVLTGVDTKPLHEVLDGPTPKV